MEGEDVTWTGEEGVGVVQLVVLKLRGLSVSDPFTGLPMVAAVIQSSLILITQYKQQDAV